VELLPVSKRKPLESILQAHKYGENIFGENRIQEAREKRLALPEDISLDFIGHLQSNKAASTVGQFRLIHSLDSLKLARKLHQFNRDADLVQPILIELNCSGENSKEGYYNQESLFGDLEEMMTLDHLDIQGFMTMAPGVQAEGVVRGVFCWCREIRDEAASRFSSAFQHLSMGMSNDFIIAIEEGATIVRIGTAIFGSRG
jgi:pyridoxal phosphate enzyme (YggS family)